MKKIITAIGILCLLLMLALVPVVAQTQPTTVTIFEGGYSHGGWSEFGSVIRINKTAPINASSPPVIEMNIWVWNRTNEYTERDGSPSYPNYTFTLRVCSAEYKRVGMSSHQRVEELYIRNVTADPVYTSDDTVWLVRNETFTLQDSDFYEDPDDGWCYILITYEGIGFNATTGLSMPGESRFLGHIKEYITFSFEYFTEVQVYDPFAGWPVPPSDTTIANAVDTTDDPTATTDTTTEVTPFAFLPLVLLPLVLRKRKQ